MKYGELKWTDVERMDKANKVVILPLGSLEQHGRHCPLITDSMLGEALAARVEAALPETVALLPMQWVGSSDHHLKFPGTISLPSALYIDIVGHVCECILAAGFRRIFLLLSHGGNDVPCQEVINRLALKHRDRLDFWVASAGWWAVADDAMRLPEMETARSTHACEYETSMVLALRADLVHMKEAKGQQPWLQSSYYFPDLTTTHRSKVNVSLPMEHMTGTGAMGRPDLASAAKGQRLLDAISAKLIDFVREFSMWPRPRVE